MLSQRRFRNPFESAFWAIVMAIGVPVVVLMFGMIRTRQLQSTANPRWAKFAKGTSSQDPNSQTASRQSIARLPTIQFQEITPSDSGHVSSPKINFTGSVTRWKPIEPTIKSDSTAVSSNKPADSRPQPEFEELPPIIFRPVDDNDDSQSVQSTRRIESQLTDVRQQLDRLTSQQRQQQAEEIARQSELLDVIAKLNERTSSDSARPELKSVPCTKEPAFDPQTPTLIAEDLPSSIEVLPTETPIAETPNLERPAPTPPDSSYADESPVRIRRSQELGRPETFSLDADNAEIRHVFAKLSEVAQISIIPSPEIQGRISLNLRDTQIDAALKAIVASQDYVVERDDNIIIVRTMNETVRRKHQNRKLIVKIYRPNYLSAVELIGMIEPLLSSDGRHSAASPELTGLARAEGLTASETTAQRDTVIVQDFPEVLDQIDQILVDVDLPPLQISIEAKILSVRLSDGIQHGIDLSQLPCHRESGVSLAEGGLKQARLSCSVPTFIKSIERLADTSIVTSQRIQVLNKHRAEMLIGDRIGYQSQAGSEVRFMEAGTRLILRPSVSADGFIRLDIHPERSSATTAKRSRQPVQTTAELTTQVMIRDGATVAIGGLIAEQGTDTSNRLPGVGSIPVIGIPFRNKREQLQRTELIVLVTPKIVIDCDSEAEGKSLEYATEERAAEFRDKQDPKSRHNLARAHYDRACRDYQQGNFVKARQQVNASLRENKTDMDAIRLRNQIDQCLMPRVIR